MFPDSDIWGGNNGSDGCATFVALEETSLMFMIVRAV
jgi:hypothetical protein